MIKLRSKSFFKVGNGNKAASSAEKDCNEIKWELRPGGMLVQKRENNLGEGVIIIRVSTMSHLHHISIQPTSTFRELKMILSLVTRLEPREQRLLFKGKERDDNEFLHMVGVRDKDKVLLLQDPAIKEKKLLAMARSQPINNLCCTIGV
ncbi:hypothetical protein TanjilG_06029 [Lupinus angustifolius]|uniref:Ubiquitin-like domain-containing protein n=1 Tax=Lupinus angustifolius TaxID=3871 RepID=A0A4P1RJ90_LUPAN|nr:PREDICTED: BAG family molecular chaperone regulator 2-like [Lupinus angustifolius]OIW12240.1 hypothetical protein TanjilG_06029 [Lupinus angustifolius]